MVEKVTKWAAYGRLFDSEAEAINHERKQDLITKITDFLYMRNIDHDAAEDTARIISANLGWFRTVLDAAAGKG
jgi:hypothetical protein